MKNFKNNKKTPKKAWDVVDAFVGKHQLKSDPMGSWTGNPVDKYEVPVQDADDL